MHHSRLCSVIVDCHTSDLDEAGRFWSAALGRNIDLDKSGDLAKYRALRTPPGEIIVEVQKVMHESRAHLDIETDDIDAEVARLEKLGAKVDERFPRWVVMQAPTGQRFCVLHPQTPEFPKNANRWE